MEGSRGCGPGPVGVPGEPRGEAREEPRLPSAAAALELREAIAAEDEWKTRLLDPRANSDGMKVAAREVVSAHFRVKAARQHVAIETGAQELPILQDDRPRFRE